MADLRDQYGNPTRQTDEYGNPISGTGYGGGGTEVGYGAAAPGAAGGYGTGPREGLTAAGGRAQQTRPEKGLHRSGSSSSSSSEDDGAGGRRKKKGLKEKIKEKMPGQRSEQQQHEAGYAYQSAQHEPEKKGFMEKIKEKMPGQH